MNHYPNEIEDFHSTLLKLKGIVGIESGVDNLEPIDSAMLGFPPFAHLPHGALLRTQGGHKNEVLIQVELETDYSPESLQSIEFLAWFVRDCARGGTAIQLRPFALPPDSPQGRQLGTSLRYHLDLFVAGIEESLQPAYETIIELTRSLEMAIRLYEIPLK